MFIERPLASLPSDRAQTSIRALVAQDQLLANRRDPNLHTIGFQEVAANWEDAGGANAFRPIGMFGYCAIEDLPIGAAIADAARGPAGLAYCIGAVEVGGVDVLKTIFIALAHRAIGQLRSQAIYEGGSDVDRRAEESFLVAIDLFRDIGNDKDAARALSDLGQHLVERGDVESARERLREARAIMRRIGLADLERVERTLLELG